MAHFGQRAFGAGAFAPCSRAPSTSGASKRWWPKAWVAEAGTAAQNKYNWRTQYNVSIPVPPPRARPAPRAVPGRAPRRPGAGLPRARAPRSPWAQGRARRGFMVPRGPRGVKFLKVRKNNTKNCVGGKSVKILVLWSRGGSWSVPAARWGSRCDSQAAPGRLPGLLGGSRAAPGQLPVSSRANPWLSRYLMKK